MRLKLILLLAGVAGMLSVVVARQSPAPKPADSAGVMQTYASKYYIIHSDLPVDELKEAVIRMNHMAEEYHARTQGFSGDVREKLPFYLYRTPVEYYEGGGMPGTAGVFMELPDGTSRLMAIAESGDSAETWHTVQHEGFHQFAHAVIRGDLPTWVNEGIAEYFGESLFTGDGFVTGVIPPSRLKRIQGEINANRFKSIKDMMLTSHEAWNMEMRIENYDQAWSMVHFLAQGENGRYQDAFVNFMKLIGRGVEWPSAWRQTFGDAVGFEQRWKDYWLNLPKNPTSDLYVQAITATFNSFIARAYSQKQTFDNFDEFRRAAKANGVTTGQTVDDWLPPKLLQEALQASEHAPAKWQLVHSQAKMPELVADLEDGTRITGTFAFSSGRLTKVTTDVDDTGAVVKQAQSLIQTGKKDQARTVLQHALKNHPKSPSAEEARKLIVQTK